MVTTVLLNGDWICAIPAGTFFFSLRLPRTPFAILVLPSLLPPPAYAGAAAAGALAALLRPTVLRGPFRVRAFVRVRWPRTGNPRRCRCPRYDPISTRRRMSIA